MRHNGKRWIGVLLSLVMVLGLIPGTGLTAYAATETYTKLMNDKTVIKFNGYNWYIIEDNSTAINAGTLTLLVADTSFGNALFDDGTNVYSNSAIKRTLSSYTDTGTFKDVAEAIINTSNGRLYLLSQEEAQGLPLEVLKANFSGGDTGSGKKWWLRTAVTSGGHVAYVSGENGTFGDAIPAYVYGVRPALKLDLSKVKLDVPSSALKGAPIGKLLTFNAQPQPLVTAGSVEGGTLEYALGKDDKTAPTDGWSTAIPTATEPGTYYVWYRVVGDENHNGVDPACVVVSIEAIAPAGSSGSADYTVLASLKTSGKRALKLKWAKVDGAEGYDVFFGECGSGKCDFVTSVNGLSYKFTKLWKGFAYKAFVRAWRTEGGAKVYIGEPSPDVHAIAGGKSNKYTNPKKISVKKKKIKLAVGGKKKIKASLTKVSNRREYLNHTAKKRWFSSDRNVATVNAKGVVTAVGPGSCKIIVMAENGMRASVKVTVK